MFAIAVMFAIKTIVLKVLDVFGAMNDTPVIETDFVEGVEMNTYRATVEVHGLTMITYVGAANKAAAIKKLESEGYKVLSIKNIHLTYQGGEIK